MFKDITQHDEFGQLLLQLIYLLCQRLGFLFIFFVDRLVEFPSEIDDLAIFSSLGLVATDNADRVSCIRF